MNPNPLAPTPMYPERTPQFYEGKFASGLPGERGPLRFEEGIATDTDVPTDFGVGSAQGLASPGRPNRNVKVDTKWPEETMQQRAHAGSASWISAPTMLGEFVDGAAVGDVVEFENAINPGSRVMRRNAVVVDW